ncbi:hypothetical protein BST97_08050 [Nonlabens spongiae]|uniref:histidine kinase n=1 Tax=Nonlabens spongiae TaxID=331648 RepID=A0A1W6MK44_9FLAO|nr:tetratricopeptide repeat-containing sensor histidine kinase [Nonlabens spongiae]ARN77953.1 hypothetical protein BST97_08050 [Nonlabens spongiae]
MILCRIIIVLVCLFFNSNSVAQDVITRAENIQSAILNASDRSEILKYYGEIIQIVDSLDHHGNNYIDGRIYTWSIKSHIEHELGEVLQSEASSIRALELLDSVENSDWRQLAKLKTYNQLGMLKMNTADPEKSILYYDKVVALTNDPIYLAIAYSNLGISYYILGEYAKALQYFEDALALKDFSKNFRLEARIFQGIGRTKSAMNLPEAESILLKSLNLSDSLNFEDQLYWSHLRLSQHYLKNDKIIKAKTHGSKALQFADSIGLVTLQLTALENLLHLEDVETANRYVILKDSLDRANQINSNKFAEVRYGVALKEREAQQLRLKNEYNTFIFIVVTVVILLISLLLYYRIRQRNRLALIQETIKTENRISKKNHDEIANDLYHTMVKMDKEQLQDAQLINEMDYIYHRVRDISNENSQIDLGKDFSISIKNLLLDYKNDSVNITALNLRTIDWAGLTLEDRTNLYRVLQELLTNMKKHSHATHVAFSFQQTCKQIKISYQDNGKVADFKKGNGITNMENRINAMNGAITFESENGNGFKAVITI